MGKFFAQSRGSSMVERRFRKPQVRGSIPLHGSVDVLLKPNAPIAQVVERVFGKDEVTGSTPVWGSGFFGFLGSWKLSSLRLIPIIQIP